MHRCHKIRLVPTTAQRDYFARACGTARFSYNWALAEWKRMYEARKADPSLAAPSEITLRRQLNAVKAEQFPWMADVTKCAPQQAIKNLGAAMQHFFRRVKTKKKSGHGYGYPAFKRKGVRDSFRADNGPKDAASSAVEVVGRRIKLPRCGVVKMREEVRFPGRVLSATVSRQADGWYVALLVDTDQFLTSVADRGGVGVDLGVKSFAVLSSGEVVPALKPHRSAQSRLRRLSRSLSRKVKGSRNRAKAKAKLARLHLTIANVRKDALHKLTHHLATRYSHVAIEDLNVSGMLHNRHLARSIADSGFAEFRRQLEYKAEMTGTVVSVVDRFFPSSRTCSDCGELNRSLTLAQREWTCLGCGVVHDRDLNAAKNILAASCAVTACGAEGSGGTLRRAVKPSAMKQESSVSYFGHGLSNGLTFLQSERTL